MSRYEDIKDCCFLYWTCVNIPYSRYTPWDAWTQEHEGWCLSNVGYKFISWNLTSTSAGIVCEFKDAEDATAFKLRFGL